MRSIQAGFRGLLPLCGAASVAACTPDGILDPQGPIAAAERLLLINSTAIMLVVVIPVIIATLAFAWWYRASNPVASRESAEEYEGRIEFVTWSIPVLVVILLGGVTWLGTFQLDPRQPIASDAKPLQVEVVAMDWKWLFIYPDQGVATVNNLVIPANTPVSFSLTSATVMNSFFVPQLGSQIYTMAGMVTRLNLLADRPGEYHGFSTNFSGDGFSDMRFLVRSVAAGDFDAWLAAAHRSGVALDRGEYAALLKPSRAVPAKTYGAVEPKLFDHIITQATGGTESSMGAAGHPAMHEAGG